jgi:hypothetical protein
MGGATSKRSIPVIARSPRQNCGAILRWSDDPSTLASQATPGWQSAEAPRREGGSNPSLRLPRDGSLRFARNDVEACALILTA